MKTLKLFVECHVRMHIDEFVYLDLGYVHLLSNTTAFLKNGKLLQSSCKQQ